MSLESEMSAGLLAMWEDNGSKTAFIRYGVGAEYQFKVIDDPLRFEEQLTDGGIVRQRLLSLTALPVAGNIIPAFGDSVVFEGYTYRIYGIERDGSSYVIQCNSIHSK